MADDTKSHRKIKRGKRTEINMYSEGSFYMEAVGASLMRKNRTRDLNEVKET